MLLRECTKPAYLVLLTSSCSEKTALLQPRGVKIHGITNNSYQFMNFAILGASYRA